MNCHRSTTKLALALTSMAIGLTSQHATPSRIAAAASDYTFISMPDYWNADVGDVSGSPFYVPAQPNSVNDAYLAADDFILSTLQGEGAADILSVGDFVEGHWGVDTLATNTFGPVSTSAEKRAAVTLSAHAYYPQVMARFTDHGFNLYPGLGDHEIGDDPWFVKNHGIEAFKYNNMGLFKATYSRHFMQTAPGVFRFRNRRKAGTAANTAYAVRPTPDVQLITLDVFRKTSTGIIPELDGAQYSWLANVLKKANADRVKWIIVQGHTSIVSPVRKFHSSNMVYNGGTASPLWQLLKRFKVDVYLAGEAHDVTAYYVDGIAQITHGGLAYYGNANYLIGVISGDRLTFTSKQFSGTADWTTGLLWQTDMTKAKPISVTYTTSPVVAGEMQITSRNQLVYRSGNLDVYTP